MNKKLKRMAVCAALLAGLALLAGCFPPSPSHTRATAYKRGGMHIWYRNTSGKVGHHMYATPRGNCTPSWDYSTFRHLSGALPPGLRFHGSRLEGVPQTPGRYLMTVRFGNVLCKGVKQGDRTVRVPIYITGVAAQRLD